MQQIVERVYVEGNYYGGNVGCIVTDQGPILIDTPMFPRDARHWREQIAQLTSLPVLYVVNTDYNPEHVLGNCFFDAPVIAHELAWEYMNNEYDGKDFRQRMANLLEPIDADAAAEMSRIELLIPQLTFTERMILEKGPPSEIRLIHLGGHTPANIVVYLPDKEILFAADNVVLDTLPALTEANSKQWLRALAAIRKMRVEVLVPGRGPLCDIEATQPLSEYIRLVRDLVRRHYQAGRSKSEMTKLIPELEDAYPVSEAERVDILSCIKTNLNQVYDEMRARYGKK